LNEETTRQILEIRQENSTTQNLIAALAPRNVDLEKTFTDLPQQFMEQQQKVEMLQQAMQHKDEANEAALAELRRKLREKRQVTKSLQQETERGFQTLGQTLTREQNQKQEQLYHALEENNRNMVNKIMELEGNQSQVQSFIQTLHNEQKTQALVIKEATIHRSQAEAPILTRARRTSSTLQTSRKSPDPVPEYEFQAIQPVGQGYLALTERSVSISPSGQSEGKMFRKIKTGRRTPSTKGSASRSGTPNPAVPTIHIPAAHIPLMPPPVVIPVLPPLDCRNKEISVRERIRSGSLSTKNLRDHQK
jgi:hypothetical protein